jgi:large subunit ribosomal protein L29
MKIEEIRAMKTDELHNQLFELRRHLFDVRAQAVTEKLEDPMLVRKTRKDIARVLTVMTERGEQNVEQHQHHLTAQAAPNRK